MLRSRLVKCSHYLTAVIGIIPFLMLVGWRFDIPILKRPIPNLGAMNPLAAILFIVFAIALFFSFSKSSSKKLHWAGRIMIIIIIAISIFHLISLRFELQFRIDHMVFAADVISDGVRANTSSMSLPAAVNFILLGIAALFVDKRTSLFQSFFILGFLLSWTYSIGFLYWVPELYGARPFAPLSLYTACCFLLLSLAILFTRPDLGLMGEFTSTFEGGMLARTLLPIAILMPLLLGYFRLWTHWLQITSTELGIALLVTSIIIIFVAAIGHTTRLINKRDLERSNMATEIVERTQALEKAVHAEKEAIELKGKFVSIASHEFRTPLSTISLVAGFLRKHRLKITEEEVNAKLNTIENQVHHMTRLLEDILIIGKIEAGKVDIHMTTIYVEQFFRDLALEIYENVKTHAINLIIECSFTEFKSDEKLIRNVVINLFTNAIKFSPDKTSIECYVHNTPEHLVIEVKDEGIGISDADQKNVYNSFQRGSNVGTIEGTGLGLSIVKNAVDLLQGDIRLQSILRRGTMFIITLPLR